MELLGKTAVVTGASRGIGRGIAIGLSQAGAKVLVHYNKGKEQAEETLSLLSGDGHALCQADLRDPEQCKILADFSITQFGAVDILVNNAGIYETLRFDSNDYETWQARWGEMLNANLLSAVNLSYLFVQQYHKQGFGKIINVTSRAGFKGERQASHYAASKGALIAFTRSMANELAKTGILVYGIAPGWVVTEMTREFVTAQKERILNDVPLGRTAEVEDVANVAVFLASDKANYLNGLIVDVNGGSYFH